MKVYCLEHKKSFLAPRRNPIKCENKSHVLGEMDFAGQRKEPVHVVWAYCCNCEQFWTAHSDERTDGSCPVCSRRISRLYLCDRCYTISYESDDSVSTKNFTVTNQ